MLESEVYVKLTKIFHDVFDEDVTLEPSTTAQGVEGWDSFSHINLTLAIEAEFGIRFTSADVERMQSVADMVAFIQRQSPL
jgi:acyl carrier protein